MTHDQWSSDSHVRYLNRANDAYQFDKRMRDQSRFEVPTDEDVELELERRYNEGYEEFINGGFSCDK